MIFSPEQLKRALPTPSSGVWWVGLSGGLDSCVLLHALVGLNLPVELRALHINHQISPNANAWQAQCAEFCAQRGVPFTAVKVDVVTAGRGLEDAAREARYAVFESHLELGDCLLTAHHADDQAETLLLRLMRGTGPRGLAAMASARPLGLGRLHRPLLPYTRDALAVYAQASGLVWVEDESNANDHYDRNYLRHQVMPLLRERWPDFTRKWQQTADLCAANEELIAQLASQDLSLAGWVRERIGSSISLTYILALTESRRQNLLRHWLREQHFEVPQQAHLQQIERQLFDARADAQILIRWGNVSLRVYRNRLYALPSDLLGEVPSVAIPLGVLSESAVISLPSGLSLGFNLSANASGTLLKTDLPSLEVRFRVGGERCRPAGRAHSQTLKRLLQDYGVEPWLRDHLPLIYSGDVLVAVADLWVCEGFVAAGMGYRISYSLPTR